MVQQITPKPGVLRIAPYVGGAAPAKGQEGVVKLSSNENPFGPSEAAMTAYRHAGRDLHRYPDTTHAALREAIGEAHRLDPERIVCGAGSDELLHLLAQAFAGQGDEVIHTEHGFAMYPIVANAAGAKAVSVSERERTVDVDAILARAGKRTKVVFIANPANPTGTMIGGNEIGRLAAGLPKGCLLVLDGAYAEYAEGYDGGAALVERSENVVMTRTFSKIHGLGGLRVGWMYGPARVVDAVNRIRGPFNLSDVQQAVAEAAIRDRTHADRSRAENTRLRAWMAEALAELGLPSDTSTANFVLVRFPSEGVARACLAFLKEEGILVRHVANYGLPHALRITVGDEASCRRVVHEIGRFQEAQAA
ncbi:MAG: histidinol-phosphate transaminase [Hasllibacter sp.]